MGLPTEVETINEKAIEILPELIDDSEEDNIPASATQ